jgi:glycosyltransferase involved in cell wall biosynthesis
MTPQDAERFEWLGEQPFSALAALRRSALVQVICSRYETFGNVATEAMALGCPVVVSRVGGLAEIVQDGRNGVLCEPEDPQDVAAKLCMLLEDPGLAERLGHQAVADCGERHDPRRLAARTIAFYERVLAVYEGQAR